MLIQHKHFFLEQEISMAYEDTIYSSQEILAGMSCAV